MPDISYFNAYHTWAEHNQFLVDLQASFPSNSELFTVGTSVEGRTIRGIRLWGTAKGKKAVVWHGTVHAREWLTAPVSVSSCCCIIGKIADLRRPSSTSRTSSSSATRTPTR